MFRITIFSIVLVLFSAQLMAQPVSSKTTIAVAKFDANEAFRRAYGDTDLGGGLSAMLVDALHQSGRFVVVERAELHGSLAEQKLAQGGLVHPASGAQAGKLIGASLLVYGSVTQFEQEESSSNIDIGFSGGGLFGGLSPRSTTGRVVLVLRIVDTTTGRVVDTFEAKGKVSESGVGFQLGSSRHGLNLASSNFKKSPVGKAARDAIKDAVDGLLPHARSQSWSGLVAAVDVDSIWINAGKDSGLQIGQFLEVSRTTKLLTDPATGEVLDRVDQAVCRVRITEVRDRVARALLIDTKASLPQRGDRVTSKAVGFLQKADGKRKTEDNKNSDRDRSHRHSQSHRN